MGSHVLLFRQKRLQGFGPGYSRRPLGAGDVAEGALGVAEGGKKRASETIILVLFCPIEGNNIVDNSPVFG
jgi:hypothetical protein